MQLLCSLEGLKVQQITSLNLTSVCQVRLDRHQSSQDIQVGAGCEWHPLMQMTVFGADGQVSQGIVW